MMDNTRHTQHSQRTDRALAAFERLFGPEFGHGKGFDLARLKRALAALGDPQQKLAPVIHVAGTNGKGSTIAFMRAIAEAAGLRAHAFTKPHLHTLNERFLVAGEIASDDALIAASERVAAADAGLTQFDAHVAAAFSLFSETPADLVLLETGMGGRDDSTNVIAAPAITIITPIGLDHQDALGAAIEEIAAHKAGILKPGAPAVIARQADAARETIEARAHAIGAPLLRQGVEWDVFAQGGRLIVQHETGAFELPPPALHGAHQIGNAGLAVMAMHAFAPDLDDAALAEGVRGARWPARLQALTRGPFSAPIRALGGEVWVDGGHNAHAAQALAHALQTLNARRAAPAIAIVGLRARKDAAAFVAALKRSVDQLIAVPLGEAHAPPGALATLARECGLDARAAPSLEAAMQHAAQSPAPRVLICGSLFLAAEALGLEQIQPD